MTLQIGVHYHYPACISIKSHSCGIGFNIWVMDYDKACFMHLSSGVVHDFPKAVSV